MEGLTPGRIVHYVLAEGDCVNPESAGVHRPAIVVATYTGNTPLADFVADLDVFLNGAIDEKYAENRAPLMNVGMAKYDPEGAPGTWHWIERA